MNTTPAPLRDVAPAPRPHPRTIGWFGTTSVSMGGINLSLFMLGGLLIGQGDIPGQGTAAVPLLFVGLLLSWAAAPGWTELILMYPTRTGPGPVVAPDSLSASRPVATTDLKGPGSGCVADMKTADTEFPNEINFSVLNLRE